MKNIHLRTIWIISLSLLLIKKALLYYAKNNTDKIEKIYSRGIYPYIAKLLTNFSNHFAFSLGELVIGVMLGMAIVILIWIVYFALKKQLRAILYITSYLILCIMLLLNYFDLSWLLNNYRTDLMTSVNLPIEHLEVEDLEATYMYTISKTNELRQLLDEDVNGYPNELSIKEILQTTYKGYSGLKSQYDFINDDKVVVKGLITSPLQTMSGYAGVYMFFVGEPNINIDAPIFTLPHTAAHEIAHQKGFALEGDANYIGFLACKNHTSEFTRYSGYLSALEYLGSEMFRVDPEKYKNSITLYDEKVIKDLLFIDSFWIQSRVESASKVVNELNDSYLKTYNQPEGIKSYNKFVELLVADYLLDSEL